MAAWRRNARSFALRRGVYGSPIGDSKPLVIDLKYLGYVQGNDNIYNALVIRGDDSFLARTGEIIFHYYKIGPIQPAGVHVTDLRFNNTQTIALTEK